MPTRPQTTPWRGLVVPALAAVLLVAVPATPAMAAPVLRDVVLDSGHIDLFELTYDADSSALELKVKDDTELYDLPARYRTPEDVSVAVDTERTRLNLEEIPPGYEFLAPAGRDLYVLDWNQQEGLPWPGWSTERLAASLPEGVSIPYESGSVRLAVDVAGPGDVFVFALGSGPGGEGDVPVDRFIDTVDPAPDVITTQPGTHYHTNWVFTAPGDYELTVTPSATTSTATTLTGPAHSYHVHVGPATGAATRVSPEELGLSIAGMPTKVAAGTDVDLEAVLASPVPAVHSFQWYHWVDGQGEVEFPGATASALTTTVDPWEQVIVAAKDASGRILSVATVFARPQEIATTITTHAVTQVYGRRAALPVTVAPQATGTVTAVVGGTTVRAALRDGRATLVLPAGALLPGRRAVVVRYPGAEGLFAATSRSVRVTVRKATPVVKVSPASPAFRRGQATRLSIAVSATGARPAGVVSATLAGTRVSARLVHGAARLSVTIPRSARTGRAALVVTFAGNATVAAGRVTRTVVVR